MTMHDDLRHARAEVSCSSAGGAPFLMAFGATILITGLLAFRVPAKTAALVALFQGNVALPLALWLERKLAAGTMSPGNPLRPLSVQLAMSQIVAFPAVLLAYALAPWAVPGALAAIGGGHFLPYAWLHRSTTYVVLGVAVSVGAFGLTLALRSAAVPWVLLYMGTVYWIAAGLVYRRAAELVRMDTARAA